MGPEAISFLTTSKRSFLSHHISFRFLDAGWYRFYHPNGGIEMTLELGVGTCSQKPFCIDHIWESGRHKKETWWPRIVSALTDLAKAVREAQKEPPSQIIPL